MKPYKHQVELDINKFAILNLDTSKISREDWHIEFNKGGEHWVYLTIASFELRTSLPQVILKYGFRTLENITDLPDEVFMIDQPSTTEKAIEILGLPSSYRRRSNNDSL